MSKHSSSPIEILTLVFSPSLVARSIFSAELTQSADPLDVARAMEPEVIPEDIKILLEDLARPA